MLVWIDLETTGLDADQHIVLEVACVITDDELQEVAAFSSLVLDCDPNTFVPLTGRDDKRPNAIYEAHFTNGLIEDLIREHGTSDWQDRLTPLLVGQHLCDFIRQHAPEPMPLAGSTVSFDRRFLREHMPWVLDAVHYRNVDVSTVKELAWRWRQDMVLPEKVGKHRALDDIYESIRLMRFYREEGFIG